MSLKEIFQAGMQESKRKSAVNKETKNLKDKERVYGVQLTVLGQKAWESKTDIGGYGNIKESLTDNQKQQDDLKARLDELQKQKQETEEKKKQENEKFDARRKEVEARKKEVDTRLNEEKNNLKNAQKESEQASNRLSQIPKEREQLNKKSMDPTTPEAEKSQIQGKLNNLVKEEEDVKNKYNEKTAAVKSLSEKVAPVQEESDRLQNQIDEIKAEQKKVIGELDKTLSENKKEADGSSTKMKEVENELRANFRQLGERIAAAGTAEPNVASEMSAIRTTENEMSDIKAQIATLEQQKSEAGSGAYKKMIMIIVGGVVILIAIIIALVILLKPKSAEQQGIDELNKEFPSEQKSKEKPGSMEDAMKQLGKGFGGLKESSEKIQGKEIVVADEGALKSVLADVGGWQLNNPSYSKGKYGEMEIANMHAVYAGPNSTEVDVNIVDTGTASVMLAGIKMLIAMNISVDNENEYQKMSTHNDIPVIETYRKQSQDASFAFIVKDRYLVELKTKGANGLDLLKDFVGKLDLSKLQ
jgi:uncharacterized phage infection (PIP) family protein YhgE